MPSGATNTVKFGFDFSGGFSDWETYWFDLGFYDRWNWRGQFLQNSNLTARGIWVVMTAGTTDWQSVSYQPIRYGDTYEGGLWDSSQPLEATLHVQGALGCKVRLGFCTWPDFTDKSYFEYGPFGDNDEHEVLFPGDGFATGGPPGEPCTAFFSFISDGVIRDGLYDGLAMQFSQWFSSGPEWVPDVGPPPPPPKQPPGKMYPGAQSLGHFPLRAR